LLASRIESFSPPKEIEFGRRKSEFPGMTATVQYLTNEEGEKTAVVLDIDAYEKLIEDLDDLTTIAERRAEKTIPHEESKKGLKRNGRRSISH
jgi:hypothetical protein